MAGFKIEGFRGFRKTRDPRLLELNEARDCRNLKFDGSGSLRAWDAPWKAAHSFGVLSDEPGTVYRYDTGSGVEWLRWDDAVEVARGPVAGDTLRRLYVTGDGVPKMTHTGIAPTFRELGLPAPVAKCETTTETPTVVVAGAIEELTCSTLRMIHEVKGSKGRNSGSGATQVLVGSEPVKLTCLQVGARVKVSSIVDVDHVQVIGVGDASFSTIVDKLNYGLQWGAPSGEQLWRRRKKAFWNFLIPSPATLKITNHGLQAGDIIQVTAATSVMSWEAQTMNTTPNTDTSARTATIAAGGNFVFTGNCNFIVDRNGQTIDPLAGNQNLDIQLRSYVYTYLTSIDEESAPSPPSDTITVYDGNPVYVDTFTAPPSGYDIDRIRLYRSNTGTNGTEFQFVAEFAATTTDYEDTVPDAELAEVLPSEEWSQPHPEMRGLVTMPNGMMAGFIRETKEICLCEPGYPHAWPEAYRYPLEHEPVTLAVFGATLFVGTKGPPYVFMGAHPRQMAWSRIQVVEPAVGMHCAVNIGDKIAYVSPNGVIVANESAAFNLTEKFIPPDQWRDELALDNSTLDIRGFWYDGTLEFAYAVDGDWTMPAFISIQFDTDGPNLSRNGRAEFNSFVEPESATLYRVYSSGSTRRVQELLTAVKEDAVSIDGTTYWTGLAEGQWNSKEFEFNPPINAAWCRIEVEYSGEQSPPLWSDMFGEIRVYSTLPNREVEEFVKEFVPFAAPTPQNLLFRLPKGFLSASMSVELNFSALLSIKSVRIGETVEDVLGG